MTVTKQKLDKMLRVKCVGCGGCCTHSIVPVTDSDIKRLMRRTGKSADELVRFYDTTDVEFDQEDPHWIEMDYGKRTIALKKKNGKCRFLDDNNRCTVYTDRPATCRTFPLAIDLDQKGNFASITLNRIIKQSYPYGAKQPVQKIKLAAQMEEREDERFYNKIDKWNKMNKRPSKQAFLKFLNLA